MRLPILAAALLGLSWLIACTGGQPSQGGVKQSCYPNGTCNAGLTCLSMLCVDTRNDASVEASGMAGSSAGVGGSAGAGSAGANAGTGGATVTGGNAGAGEGGAGGAAGATGAAGADAAVEGGSDGGTDGPRDNGSACSVDDQCGSGFCVDGRCCSVSSCSTCQACTGVGGTCTPVAKRDADSCNGTKTCDSDSRCVTRIAEFPLPGMMATPIGISGGPNGTIWFALPFARKIDRLLVDGTGLMEFPIAHARAVNVISGPDGNIWFTTAGEVAGEIISRANVTFTDVKEFTPSPPEQFGSLANGPDGKIWYLSDLGRIGRIGLDGTGLTTFPAPPKTRCLTLAPDGNLWFADYTVGKVGRFRPSDGKVTEFDVIGTGSQPICIAMGPDGNLWFTDDGANQVGRIDPSGAQITLFPIHTPKSGAYGITGGPDGNVWFAEPLVNKIGRISPATGAITEFTMPNANSEPAEITLGPDGNLWFTEIGQTSRIGRIMP